MRLLCTCLVLDSLTLPNSGSNPYLLPTKGLRLQTYRGDRGYTGYGGYRGHRGYRGYSGYKRPRLVSKMYKSGGHRMATCHF